jgi:hypothetical protein
VKRVDDAFENKALRRIFRPKREKVKGKWENYYEKFSYVLFTRFYEGDQINENNMGEACSTQRDMRNAY